VENRNVFTSRSVRFCDPNQCNQVAEIWRIVWNGSRRKQVLTVLAWFILPGETLLDSCWNVMAHGDARKGKWGGNWRMEWVASTLHTTSEHGVSSITTADAHTSAASSRLNWRLRRFKWTRPFRRKTKSGFCACAVTFQLASILSFQSFVFNLLFCVVI